MWQRRQLVNGGDHRQIPGRRSRYFLSDLNNDLMGTKIHVLMATFSKVLLEQVDKGVQKAEELLSCWRMTVDRRREVLTPRSSL